ncbi:GspH/FimT family pseudopilin [Dyella sp.]|jgi:type IV fimbrial biogenesis protein FimT|uniref:GspH/FimT family pseudopilin n=1 Tax=Dyella sp. TaxID=1869338 RepID=UPI002FDA321E
MNTAGQRGVSLIELMVAVAILAILTVLGIPSFQQWTLNTRIRTVSESIQNGLRLARNEAAQRANDVRFQLTSASSWQVCVLPASAASAAAATDCSTATSTVQQWSSPGSASNVQVDASTAVTDVAAGKFGSSTISGGLPAGITFDPLGRPTSYGSNSILRIDVTAAQSSLQATSRRLVTIISAGGMVSMCDPAFLLSSNAMGCP